jgi:fido (protein-threonine AMPylation protein)
MFEAPAKNGGFVRGSRQFTTKDPEMSVRELPTVFPASAAPRSSISDAVARGEIRRIARGLYTRNLTDPVEHVIRQNLYPTIAALYPGAVIADRSARLGRPAEDGSLFLVHDRTAEATLPGLVLRPRKGPGPIKGDLPLPAGLHMSSIPRALLENSVLTRSRRHRSARTLSRPELEEWIESLLEQYGDDGLRAFRERARAIASGLGLDEQLATLDPLVGAVLGTRRDVRATSAALRARQAGHPVDPRRLDGFEQLFQALERTTPITRPVLDPDAPRYRYLPFFEAYFSNFIEGTEFAVEEARAIVFDGVVPANRPQDAHDVTATYRLVSDRAEMSRVPADADAFVSLLRSRHRVLMEARAGAAPGAFKQQPNRVGSITFVAPALVEGTLRAAFAFYERLLSPFARAAYLMFVVAEVHPFTDGNGRIARIMMNAELVAASEQRIIIPQVYRNNYLMALRALTVNGRPEALISMLEFAQRYTASIDYSDFDAALRLLEETNAFNDPVEADAAGVRLVLPPN